MLTLTDTASTAVSSITERTLGQDSDGGLRISSGQEDGFEVTIASGPQPTDEVVTSGQAHVYLEQNASSALTDKVLDAEIDETGAVRFALANA